MASMTPTMLAIKYGTMIRDNQALKDKVAYLEDKVRCLEAKEFARLERQRMSNRRYAERRAARQDGDEAMLPASPPPEPEHEPEPVPVPVPEPEAVVIDVAPQTPGNRVPRYTAKSLDDEIRITSQIDAGIIKSATPSVSWSLRSKHHPNNADVQLVLLYIRANPLQEKRFIYESTGLEQKKVDCIVRELKKQGIVMAV